MSTPKVIPAPPMEIREQSEDVKRLVEMLRSQKEFLTAIKPEWFNVGVWIEGHKTRDELFAQLWDRL